MEPFTITIAAITGIGALLKVILPYFNRAKLHSPGDFKREDAGKSFPSDLSDRESPRKVPSAQLILIIFAVVVCIFGLITLVRYWEAIRQNEDSFYFVIWLFLSMVGGMFVQVLATNYRSGRTLFEVNASQLIFPLLFSVIVFYPIWAIAASAAHSFFSIHAAFLNGYFWESVVSSARLPEQPD